MSNPQADAAARVSHPDTQMIRAHSIPGVIELFEAACAAHPDAVAIEWRERRVTYAELDFFANTWTRTLEAGGLGAGSIVGVMLDDRIDLIASMIGIFRAGAVFVPLDPEFPAARLQAICEDCSPDAILVRDTTGSIVRSIPCKKISSAECNSHSSLVASAHNPERLAYIYYTSGSTGHPKGIAGRLMGVDHFIRWETETLRAHCGIRVSQFAAPTFDAFLRDVFLALANGGTICIPPEKPSLLTPAALVDWIEQSRINVIHCVPTLFNSIIGENLRTSMFTELTHVLLAGEMLHVYAAKRWLNVFGPRIRLINLYGSTETTMVKFFHRVTVTDLAQPFIPIGKPMPGAKALIVDEHGQPCAPGTPGEIWIRSPYLTLGYYKNDAATRRVFIPNPFTSDPYDIVYRTGDTGRLLNDGNFQLLGRNDDMIKIRGVRVELSEIENALRTHAGVSNAVVVVREDSSGAQQLVAYFVGSATVESLRNHLRSHLPENMVPATFTQLDSLPQLTNGKIDRQNLPKPAANVSATNFIAPRTPAESELSRIWSELLGREKIGISDNFFDVGGHSLLAAQVVARVRNNCGVDLPVRALFERPTIEQLAEEVAHLQASGIDPDELARLMEEIEAEDEELAAAEVAHTEI